MIFFRKEKRRAIPSYYLLKFGQWTPWPSPKFDDSILNNRSIYAITYNDRYVSLQISALRWGDSNSEGEYAEWNSQTGWHPYMDYVWYKHENS